MDGDTRSVRLFVVVVLVLLAGCSGTGGKALVHAPGRTTTSAPSSTSTTSSTTSTISSTATSTTRPSAPVVIRYRIESHTSDAATADFATVVDTTLHDPRGWQRAGFVFQRATDAPYMILLAEAP